MTDIATTEPLEIVAGDRIRWKRTLTGYPATTWTLTYALRNADSKIDITASADGTDHLVDEATGDTAAWAPGTYDWQAFVSDGSSRYIAGSGQIKILQNLAEDAVYDGRSHAQIMLNAIEDRLQGRAISADIDTLSYSIAGYSLSRMSITELVPLRDKYKAEVARERKADQLRKGGGHRGRILVRQRH